MLGAKARALIEGRSHATIQDVQALAAPVLRHRILLNYRAEAEGLRVDDVVRRLLGGDHGVGPPPGAGRFTSADIRKTVDEVLDRVWGRGEHVADVVGEECAYEVVAVLGRGGFAFGVVVNFANLWLRRRPRYVDIVLPISSAGPAR